MGRLRNWGSVTGTSKRFFSSRDQNASAAHSTSYQVETRLGKEWPSLGVKRPRHEVDRSPKPSTEIKNTWNVTSTPTYVLTTLFVIQSAQNFYFQISNLFRHLFSYSKGTRSSLELPSFSHFQSAVFVTNCLCYVIKGRASKQNTRLAETVPL